MNTIIELLNPHFENPALTHIEVVAVTDTDIAFRWHDGAEAKGSVVRVSHGFNLDGEFVAAVSEEEIADAVDAYLQAEQERVNQPQYPSLEQQKSFIYQAWKEIPDDVRTPFIPYWPAVNLAIDIRDFDEARRIINAIPTPPELEQVRGQFYYMIP